jgi:hypothetical protein
VLPDPRVPEAGAGRRQERWAAVGRDRDRDGVGLLVSWEQPLVGLWRRRAGGAGWAKAVGVDILVVVVPVAVVQE